MTPKFLTKSWGQLGDAASQDAWSRLSVSCLVGDAAAASELRGLLQLLDVDVTWDWIG